MKYIKEKNFKLGNNKIDKKNKYIIVTFLILMISIFSYAKLYFQEGIEYYGNFLVKKEITNKKCAYIGKSDSHDILLEFEELSNNNKLIDLEIGEYTYQYILEPGYLGRDVRLFDKSNNNVFEGNINVNTKSILYDDNNLKFQDVIENNKEKSIYNIENPDPLLLLMISEEQNLNIRGDTKKYLGVSITMMSIITIFIIILILKNRNYENQI